MGKLRDKGIDFLVTGFRELKLADPERICDDEGAKRYVANQLGQPQNKDDEYPMSYTGIVGALKVMTFDLSNQRISSYFDNIQLQSRSGMLSKSGGVEVVLRKDKVDGIGRILYGWIPQSVEDTSRTEN